VHAVWLAHSHDRDSCIVSRRIHHTVEYSSGERYKRMLASASLKMALVESSRVAFAPCRARLQGRDLGDIIVHVARESPYCKIKYGSD
jgi:hypothetical protein